MDLKRARQSKNVMDARGSNQTGVGERSKEDLPNLVNTKFGQMYKDSIAKAEVERKNKDVTKSMLTQTSLRKTDTPKETKDYNKNINDLRAALPELASKDLIANRKYSGPASKLVRKSK